MLRIFNTLTRRVEEVKLIKVPEVKLYTCGPTVYDYATIGNLRSFVFYDILRRAMEFDGLSVKHVMNITDVGHLVSDMDQGQDKIEKGAQREGKTVWQVAQYFTDAFKKDVAALNNLPPSVHRGGDVYVKATDFIVEQIELIERLLEKGYAYQTEEAIYFDVTKLSDYGELSGQKLEDKQVGVRKEVVTDGNKKNQHDFAIWFFTVGRFAHHTMRWPSPWGEGFPGWHLECSAIIHSLLGEPIDVHTGGVDHIGTHHTNEIAQSEAAYGHKLANYWVHNEFLLVDGQKMSKSLNNFYTLAELKKKGFEPQALRLLFLQAHYRSQLNFTWDSLEAAQQLLSSWEAWSDLVYQPKTRIPVSQQKVDHLISNLKKHVDDDLNTPKAIAEINTIIDKYAPTLSLLEDIDKLLGFTLSSRVDIAESQKAQISKREEARIKKDWARADEIRSELEKQRIGIEDTQGGPIWYRL